MFNQLVFAMDELLASPSREFYNKLFQNLDLSKIQPAEIAHTGRKPTDFHALIRACIVMKCERFAQISDLWDYLNNNRIIAYLCGFGLEVPSYSVLQRFIKDLDHQILEKLMQQQVLECAKTGLITAKILAEDSTPIYANVVNNNPKTFMDSKFSNANPPKGDKDCKLGFHANSNAIGETKGEFYWGYKEHILIDVLSGLPICCLTTGANVHDSAVALDILAKTHGFLPLSYIKFLADKAFDSGDIYEKIAKLYKGKCFIPLNLRAKKSKTISENGIPFCEDELAMVKNGTRFKNGSNFQRFTCPFNWKFKGKCPIERSKGCDCYLPLEKSLRLSINRETRLFKRTYAMRTETERYNSRFKALGTENPSVRNFNSIQNLNTIAHISLLTVALTASKLNGQHSTIALKSLKRAC